MSNRTLHQFLTALTVILDVSLIGASTLVAYWLRFESEWPQALAIYKGASPPLAGYFQLIPLLTLIWIVTLRRLGLYRVANRVTLEKALNLSKAAILALIATLGVVFFLYHSHEYSRWVMVLASGMSVVFLLFNRLAVQRLRRAIQQMGVGVSRVGVVGFNATTGQFIHSIHGKGEDGYQFIGVVIGDQPPTQPVPYRVLGGGENVRNLVQKHHLHELFITSPAISHREILQIVHACEGLPVHIHVLPDLYEVMIGNTRVTEFDAIPVVNLKEIPLQGWHRLLKRSADIVLSALALVVFSPILLVVTIAVKLTSPGKVVFKQERIGRDGKPFNIYKFRSMGQDAEDGIGHTWATPNDPRQTRIGPFLRRWSLDELPQFFNVLRGDMSLVGPRPEMSGLIDDFSKTIPHYLDRYRVKCGMTGWAQINGLRGNTSLEERINYDLYYIENWSFTFDIKIVLRTLWAIKEGSK